MTETPLIYTSRGNVPIDSLRYEHEWVDTPQMLILHERWFDKDSGELVKNNSHGYVKRGASIDGQQAQM